MYNHYYFYINISDLRTVSTNVNDFKFLNDLKIFCIIAIVFKSCIGVKDTYVNHMFVLAYPHLISNSSLRNPLTP